MGRKRVETGKAMPSEEKKPEGKSPRPRKGEFQEFLPAAYEIHSGVTRRDA